MCGDYTAWRGAAVSVSLREDISVTLVRVCCVRVVKELEEDDMRLINTQCAAPPSVCVCVPGGGLFIWTVCTSDSVWDKIFMKRGHLVDQRAAV